MRKFTEVRKHSRCACSSSFLTRDEKNGSDYVDFSARLAGLKIQGRFENTGLGFLRVLNRFFGTRDLA